MSSERILTEARRWIGTPYVHQMSARQSGCDCLGLVRGIWRELVGAEPEALPAYSADWGEPQGEEVLWEAAGRHLRERPIGLAEPGDLLLFRMRSDSVAKHLGICGQRPEGPSFIHAYSGHGVIESLLTAPWRRRLVACFALAERID